MKGESYEYSDLRNEEMQRHQEGGALFQERGIRYQFIDMNEKGMSKRELSELFLRAMHLARRADDEVR